MKAASLSILVIALAACSGGGGGGGGSAMPTTAEPGAHTFTSSQTEVLATPTPIPATANNTVWVAPPPTGSDSNNGTHAAPYATITKAVTSGNGGNLAGWTVAVEDGKYTPSNSTYLALLSNKTGVAGSPITIQAQHNLGATLDGGTTTDTGFDFDPGVSYITIQGFVMKGFYGGAVWANGGSSLVAADANNNVRVLWNDITNNPGNGIVAAEYSTNITIKYNEIDHSGIAPSPCNGQYHGVYLRATNAQISSNVFHDNNCGYDIQYANKVAGQSPSFDEYNNTFGYHSGSHTNVVLYSAVSGAQTPSLDSENDLFTESANAALPILCYSGSVNPTNTPIGSPKIIAKYDMWTNTAGTQLVSCTADVTSSNNQFQLPDFVAGNSPPTGTTASGYQLLSGSKAFGNGTALTSFVLKDFYGDTPTSPWTIGAFQNATP